MLIAGSQEDCSICILFEVRNESRRHVRAVLSLALVSILPACGKTHDAPLPPSPPGVVNSRWVWMGGTSNCNVMGSYGTQGTADPSNYPGGRVYAASWNDSSGNRMVFGGTTPPVLTT